MQLVCPMAKAFPGKEKCIALFPTDHEPNTIISFSLSTHLNKKLHIIKHEFTYHTCQVSFERLTLPHSLLYFIFLWKLVYTLKKKIICLSPPTPPKKLKKRSREKGKTFLSTALKQEKEYKLTFFPA